MAAAGRDELLDFQLTASTDAHHLRDSPLERCASTRGDQTDPWCSCTAHGADTSSWDGEYDALTKQGYDVRAIANPLESLDRLHTHLQRLRQIAKRRPPRMQQTVSEHLAICAAIHDGDETAAAQATALHIINSLHNILAVMTDDVIGRTTFATPTTADGHEQETRCDTR